MEVDDVLPEFVTQSQIARMKDLTLTILASQKYVYIYIYICIHILGTVYIYLGVVMLTLYRFSMSGPNQ